MSEWNIRTWNRERNNPIPPNWRRYVLYSLGILAVFAVFRYVLPLIMPFVVGFIIALLIEPVVRLSGDKGGFRPLLSLVSLLVLAGVVTLLLTIAVTRVVTELEQLVNLLPKYEKDITKLASEQFVILKGYYDRLPDPVMSAIDTSGQAIYDKLAALTKAVINSVKALPNLFITTTVALLSAYFMSRDKVDITSGLTKPWPDSVQVRFRSFKGDFLKTMGAYIRAQLILMFITTVVSLAFLLYLRMKYAWILGLSLGLLDILPMLGPAALLVPWAILAFFMGARHVTVWLMVLLGVLMVTRQLFEARVVGDSIGVHPLLTLLALYVSINLFGGWGFVLGPMVVIVGTAFYKSFKPREKTE